MNKYQRLGQIVAYSMASIVMAFIGYCCIWVVMVYYGKWDLININFTRDNINTSVPLASFVLGVYALYLCALGDSFVKFIIKKVKRS